MNHSTNCVIWEIPLAYFNWLLKQGCLGSTCPSTSLLWSSNISSSLPLTWASCPWGPRSLSSTKGPKWITLPLPSLWLDWDRAGENISFTEGEGLTFKDHCSQRRQQFKGVPDIWWHRGPLLPCAARQTRTLLLAKVLANCHTSRKKNLY